MVRLRGAVGARMPEDGTTPRPSVDVTAVGDTYDQALKRLQAEVPDGRLLLWVTRLDDDDSPT